MRYRPRSLVIVAVLAGLAWGCGGSSMPKGSYGTLFGRVTSSSGQPISGATVVVDIVVKATTDAGGMYTVTTVPVDAGGTSTTVCAQAAGFQSKTANPPPTVAENARVEVNISLSPGSSGPCTGG
ncbi:MAG: carboxypeptidase regulatory-like domain-containing protein [Candidatus Eremiobacteraeota bacterium]|nr:carboxypeptidase regulatory-like domain-containing protein [Candidatus Eremiobacteraeota bacterium]MBC5827129.1 carboxypeptidase regulatory-like domain-containing protein [Candidatus Eremiobacteraeota bacterium]